MSERRLRASLLIAGAGAVVVLIDVAGLTGELAGLGLIGLGVALAAPGRRPPLGDQLNWWRLLVAGAGAVAAGVALGLAVESAGQLLASIGGVMIVIAAALGLP